MLEQGLFTSACVDQLDACQFRASHHTDADPKCPECTGVNNRGEENVESIYRLVKSTFKTTPCSPSYAVRVFLTGLAALLDRR